MKTIDSFPDLHFLQAQGVALDWWYVVLEWARFRLCLLSKACVLRLERRNPFSARLGYDLPMTNKR